MQKYKKHIAGFLLTVFAFGVIPAPLFHEIFANHTDAAENHCHYYHKDLGRHMEEQQNHCDIFKADTPLYDVVKIAPCFQPFCILIAEFKQRNISSYSFAQFLSIPARAPPVI